MKKALLFGFLGAQLVATTACESDADKTTLADTTIVGLVQELHSDQNRTPLAQATIKAVELNATAVSDAEGRFSFVGLGARTAVVLRLSATGYGEIVKRVTLLPNMQNFVAVSLSQLPSARSVTIPAAGEDDATVTEGPVSVSFGADELVVENDDGTTSPATGTIDVTVAVYDPETMPFDLPAGLIAMNGTTLSPLYSFGMAEILLRQNGKVVNVAAGKTITWSFTVNEARRTQAAAMPAHNYWLNPDTGYWEDDGAATYDATTGTYSAELTHLSGYNIDYAHPRSSCVVVRVTIPKGVDINTTPNVAVSDAGGPFGSTYDVNADGSQVYSYSFAKDCGTTSHVRVSFSNGRGASPATLSAAAIANGDAGCVDTEGSPGITTICANFDGRCAVLDSTVCRARGERCGAGEGSCCADSVCDDAVCVPPTN